MGGKTYQGPAPRLTFGGYMLGAPAGGLGVIQHSRGPQPPRGRRRQGPRREGPGRPAEAVPPRPGSAPPEAMQVPPERSPPGASRALGAAGRPAKPGSQAVLQA